MTQQPVLTSYLGYPILVDEGQVRVFTPSMRHIGDTTSVKKARLLVRGYRRADK